MLMHNRNEYLRYQAFVAHMVNAYDDILNVVERSTEKDAKKEWLVAFDVDIKPHRRYLCHPADPRFAEMYRSEMQRLLRAAAGDCKDKAPLVEVQALRPTPISE